MKTENSMTLDYCVRKIAEVNAMERDTGLSPKARQARSFLERVAIGAGVRQVEEAN